MRSRISLDDELEKLKRYKVNVITGDDPGYPLRLKQIYDYPPLLYIRGTLVPEDEWAIAVVGTRRASVYGRQVAEEIVTDLVRNKITIVSGLARGIDAMAHRHAHAGTVRKVGKVVHRQHISGPVGLNPRKRTMTSEIRA